MSEWNITAGIDVVDMEVEDVMFCCLGDIPVIDYIFDSRSKEIRFYVEPHLDMAKVTMANAIVTKVVNQDSEGYDVEIYCPVCGKPTITYGHIPNDWKVLSGPDRTLTIIPLNEIPKDCIIASKGIDLTKNPETLGKWFRNPKEETNQ